MIIEGRNPVLEALKGEVTIEKLLVQKGLFGGSVDAIVKTAREEKVKLMFVEKQAIDKLSLSGRHQGVLAVATEYKYWDFETLLEKRDKSKPMTLVLLDGVEDPHNVGAIIRVAECSGATGVVIPKHRASGVTETAIKVSAGATAYVPVAKVTNLNDAIRTLKDMGVTVFAADAHGKSVYRTDLKGDFAIIIGGEGSGVKTLTKKLANEVLSLPQLGKVNSLNASVACGVFLYEAVRQRGE